MAEPNFTKTCPPIQQCPSPVGRYRRFQDLTGKRFNRLVVLGYAGVHKTSGGNNKTYWVCVCRGTKENPHDALYGKVPSANMKSGNIKSCGCYHRENVKRQNFNDLTGKIFDRLTVIKQHGWYTTNSGKKRALWSCHCLCGNTTIVVGSSLTTGNIKSCGCKHKEQMQRIGDTKRTHGMSKTNEYSIWCDMKKRCFGKETKLNRTYKRRGIAVCQQLNNSFQSFLQIVGKRPSTNHSLDRINNDLHYSCGSCTECIKNGWPPNIHWATIREQANNTSTNVYITFNNETHTVTEWERILGFNGGTVYCRLRRGWTIKDALTLPLHSVVKHKINPPLC